MKWECKYHLVWIPKYQKKSLYGELRRYLRSTFRELAMQRESRVIEGRLLPDHAHVLISILPKYAMAQVVGYLKEKCHSHRAYVYGPEEELYGSALLGALVFCLDSRHR